VPRNTYRQRADEEGTHPKPANGRWFSTRMSDVMGGTLTVNQRAELDVHWAFLARRVVRKAAPYG